MPREIDDVEKIESQFTFGGSENGTDLGLAFLASLRSADCHKTIVARSGACRTCVRPCPPPAEPHVGIGSHTVATSEHRLSWERAAAVGGVRVLDRMRRSGHDIDAKDGYGLTALMRAAHEGQEDAVAWLIAEGADLDHTSKFHLSALMLAVIGAHNEVARLLERAGADVNIDGSGAPGFAGKSAAEIAEGAGNRRLAAYIRGQGR